MSVVSLVEQFGPFLGLAALLGALPLAAITLSQRHELQRLTRWAELDAGRERAPSDQ